MAAFDQHGGQPVFQANAAVIGPHCDNQRTSHGLV
jgi:hypothetical protein